MCVFCIVCVCNFNKWRIFDTCKDSCLCLSCLEAPSPHQKGNDLEHACCEDNSPQKISSSSSFLPAGRKREAKCFVFFFLNID